MVRPPEESVNTFLGRPGGRGGDECEPLQANTRARPSDRVIQGRDNRPLDDHHARQPSVPDPQRKHLRFRLQGSDGRASLVCSSNH